MYSGDQQQAGNKGNEGLCITSSCYVGSQQYEKRLYGEDQTEYRLQLPKHNPSPRPSEKVH